MKVLDENKLEKIIGGKQHNWSVAKCGGTIGVNMAAGVYKNYRKKR